MKIRNILTAIVLSMGVIVLGCASPTPVQELKKEVKAPDWVVKGSGAFDKDKENVFYGVGSASGIRNNSLLRTTADNRARNEIAKVFEVYTASLMKDYMASTSATDPKAVSEEQHVEQAIKTVTSMTLNGVEIIDHWQNPESGEFYSLAKMDLATFKNNIDKVKELNDKVKEFIRQDADRLHDELAKEEDNGSEDTAQK